MGLLCQPPRLDAPTRHPAGSAAGRAGEPGLALGVIQNEQTASDMGHEAPNGHYALYTGVLSLERNIKEIMAHLA